jgi:antagonist of KipI
MARPRDSQPLAVHPLGDAAVAITIPGVAGTAETTAAVRATAEAIEQAQLPGVVDVVSSPDRVTLCCDPAVADTFPSMLTSIHDAIADIRHNAEHRAQAALGKTHEIPVHYGGQGGPDLNEACHLSGLERERFIHLHTTPDYLVTAVGFTPGFAYLGGLDPRLCLPRRATPRTSVPAGSVGIGGPQTGVYPSVSPGGWQIIGHTTTRFFDPTAPSPALCAVGDRVRFVASGSSVGGPVAEEHSPPSAVRRTDRRPDITVITPGLMTSVQDLGRPGYRACGVTPGGAADPIAAMLANQLVGNPPQAAVLELTLFGPTLKFERDALVSLTGASFPGLAGWRPHALKAGTTIALGHATRGCRGYLAIAGGIDVPMVLGSRSTHLDAGFGGLAGRPLIAGDQLPVGQSRVPLPEMRWSLSPNLLELPDSPARLRLILPEEQSLAAEALLGRPYRVTSRSNRMGLRLAGSPLPVPTKPDTISRAVIPGTVQLPPDGQPILLLADCQTIGGYPVIGHVASADLRLAAQLRPGDTLTFEPTTREEASASWHALHRLVTATSEGIAARWPLRLATMPNTRTPRPAPTTHRSIDLNCDVGESAGHDDELIPLVSSVNIACGGHAGDAASMAAAVHLARAHGVAIGAHPGHPDREYFGRRQLPITSAEAAAVVCKQVADLAAIIGHPPGHVKLHGGLYHQVAYDPTLAETVVRALAGMWPGIRIILPAGSPAVDIAKRHGLHVSREGFLDRSYTDTGRLVDRSEPGSVLTKAADVSTRAVRLVRDGVVVSQRGCDLPLIADTLCLHGDGPAAVSLLRAVRAAFAQAGIHVTSHAARVASSDGSADCENPLGPSAS